MRKLHGSIILASLLAFTMCTGSAVAAPIVLTFEGLGNLEFVQNFYNGGTGSLGSAGTNFGVAFSSNSLAIIDSDAGGSGNFGGEPSPDTVLFFLNGSANVMNVAAGFTTGFSFFYSAIEVPGSVTVFDGLNGTGTQLGSTLALPLTTLNGAPDPTGAFSPLVAVGVAFTGTAKSVSFAGVANRIGFDNITFGSATAAAASSAVPEPSSLVLFGIGAIGLFGYGWRKCNTACHVLTP